MQKETKKKPAEKQMREQANSDTTFPNKLIPTLKVRRQHKHKLASLNFFVPTNSNALHGPQLSLSISNSVNMSHEAPAHQSIDSAAHKEHFYVEVHRIQTQLTLRLAAIKASADMSSDKFKVYQKTFEKIIRQDDKFGFLLSKIKTAYEDWFKAEETSLTELRLKLKAKDLDIEKMEQDGVLLEAKLIKLSEQNSQLNRALAEAEAKFVELEDRPLLFSLGKSQSGEENSWQDLVSENKYYADVVVKLQRDLRYMKHREHRLLSLINALKSEGLPVEQIFKKEYLKRRLAKISYTEVAGLVTDDEETDPFVEGLPKAVEKPKVVPLLSLAEVEPDLSSNSETEFSESGNSI
jgi:hypothetical protein